jgi:tRNA splicing ligase
MYASWSSISDELILIADKAKFSFPKKTFIDWGDLWDFENLKMNEVEESNELILFRKSILGLKSMRLGSSKIRTFSNSLKNDPPKITETNVLFKSSSISSNWVKMHEWTPLII